MQKGVKILRYVFFQVLFWILTMYISFPILGQNLDSLKNALSKEKSIEKRIDLLKALGEGHMNDKPTEAIQYFEELINIAEKEKDKILKVYAINRIGTCWVNKNDFKKSIQFYFEALEIAEDSPEFFDMKSRIYNNLGWSFKGLEDYKKALKYFLEAEYYARKTGNKTALGLILNNKGVTHKNLEEFDQALINLNESLSLNREVGNKKQERFNLNNISVIYLKKNQANKAIDNLKQLLKLNEEIGDTIELINNLQNLGNAYSLNSDYTKAENSLLTALAYTEKKKNAQMKQYILSDLSTSYQNQGKLKEGLEYFRKFYLLSDSLKQQETNRYAMELETNYGSLMKERELEKARKELAEKQLHLTWIIVALTLTIFLVIFFSRIIYLKKRNERRLIELNNEIEAQAEELMQANEEIHSINENLEKLIIERTTVIRNQNMRLRQFSFMNAHKVRGPVATILGLINLLSDTRNENISKDLLKHLLTSSQNLDQVIHEVGRQLEEDGVIPGEESEM